MNGKLFLRQVASSPESSTWLAMGVLDLPPTAPDEVVVTGLIDTGAKRFQLFLSDTRALDIQDPPLGDLQAGELVMRSIWRRGAIPGGAEFFLRRCPIKTPTGHLATLVFGPIDVPAAQDLAWQTEHLYTLENGHFAGSIDHRESTRGKTADLIAQLPIWGWGREPVGLVATYSMDTLSILDMLNGMQRFPALLASLQGTELPARFEWYLKSYWNHEYAAFREKLFANEVLTNFMVPRTAEMLKMRAEISALCLRLETPDKDAMVADLLAQLQSERETPHGA